MQHLTPKSCCHRWTTRTFKCDTDPVKVLVVDDIAAVADAVSAALSSDRYIACPAYSGPEAVELCENTHPRVVLMDITMPGYNGFTAARILRKLRPTSDLVIIAYTALSESSVLNRVRDAEFDGYWQKGEPIKNLIALIDSTRV